MAKDWQAQLKLENEVRLQIIRLILTPVLEEALKQAEACPLQAEVIKFLRGMIAMRQAFAR